MAYTLLNPAFNRLQKLSGAMVRASKGLPDDTLRLLAKVFGYKNQHPTLEPQLQLLLAINDLVGGPGAGDFDPVLSRQRFRDRVAMFAGEVTAVAAVHDYIIPNRIGSPIGLRHYLPIRSDDQDTPLPLLVFFHGGGMLVGDLDTHDEPCRLLCQHGQMQVLSVNYRLLPEHPVPAAIEDGIDAMHWAHAHATKLGADPDRIVIGGDSAGGNLATVISQQLTDHPVQPVAQLLIYPAVDMHGEYPSYDTYGEGLYFSRASHYESKEIAFQRSDIRPDDPLISPIFGNLAGQPPLLMVIAELDMLRDEGELYASKMADAGSPSSIYRVIGQGHGFLNATAVSIGAYEATIKIAQDFSTLVQSLAPVNQP